MKKFNWKWAAGTVFAAGLMTVGLDYGITLNKRTIEHNIHLALDEIHSPKSEELHKAWIAYYNNMMEETINNWKSVPFLSAILDKYDIGVYKRPNEDYKMPTDRGIGV